MKTYNIALSASKQYSPYALVLMTSFYKYHPGDQINVYLFYLDPTIKKLEKGFVNIAKKYNNSNIVEFVKVDYSQIEVVDNKNGWAIDLWCRWYLLDYLVNKCDRILILGIDTMIKSNIEKFYFDNLDGYYFSACPDMFVNSTNSDSWPKIEADMIKYNLLNKSRYINGDVVIVNLQETKNKLSFNNFLDYFAINQFICWDQDIITYCFNDKIKFNDYLEYNYFPNLGIDNINDNYANNNAKIIHFAGGPKPWNIPVCLSKNYNAIPEWWSNARIAGVAKKLPYNYCFLLFTYRFFRDLLKKLKIKL